jgi:NAD(P)-dependent dehydrogenase (short-subunit alcohol dehydrogenase family)
VAAFLLNIISTTVVDAFSNGEILQVLLFAVPFGLGLSRMGQHGRNVVHFLDEAGARGGRARSTLQGPGNPWIYPAASRRRRCQNSPSHLQKSASVAHCQREEANMPAERKCAIVTGAASGMGRAMALGLCQVGFNVVAVDRNPEGLGTLPAPIKPVATDLAQSESFDRIVSETIGAFGRIDVLVNNAGIGQAAIRDNQRRSPIRFWEVTPEQWNRFFTVNATGPIMMSRAVLPHMLKTNSGRIITVTTSLGTMVREGYLLYGSSKAAAESSMAVLAADLKGTAVTANVLVPGGVTDTPLVGDAGDRSKMLRPEIMLPPLLWLVSDEASAINGRRFIAADWDTRLKPAQAAEAAGAPVAWLSIARMPIEPG